MRFAHVPVPASTGPAPSAAEFLRRLIGIPAQGALAEPLTSKGADDVPCDLDQRVRLVGEW
jgi:hypothetical protein